jgi:Flp pilus assembly protein TadG
VLKARVQRNGRVRGSSIVESLAGLLLLIPMALLFVDLAALVLAQTANDALAKQAARSAAQTTNLTDATAAVTVVIQNFRQSKLMTVTSTSIPTFADSVTVKTFITCTLPIPLPFVGITYQNFVASATEPVVGNLPSSAFAAS